MVKYLPEFVLVRLQPLNTDEDLTFAKKHGIEKFPALLFLESDGEGKLGALGEVPGETIVEEMRRILGK